MYLAKWFQISEMVVNDSEKVQELSEKSSASFSSIFGIFSPGVEYLLPKSSVSFFSLLEAKDLFPIPVALKRKGTGLPTSFADYIKNRDLHRNWDKGDYKSPLIKVRIAYPDEREEKAPIKN